MTKKIHRRGVIAGAALAVPMLARHGWAQSTYPNKQIRMVVPFAPGGVTDTSGRVVSGARARVSARASSEKPGARMTS